MTDLYLDYILSEIKMTTGCTDPGVIAYAASVSASKLDGEPEKISIKVSTGIYKNALYVYLPGLMKNGIESAALLGAIIKRPEEKLSVLAHADETVLNKYDVLKNEIEVILKCQECDDPLYVEVKCENKTNEVTTIIKEDYDCIYSIIKDGIPLYQDKEVESKNPRNDLEINAKNIFDYAVKCCKNNVKYLLEYERINREAVLVTDEVTYNEIENIAALARKYVFSASRRRMNGEIVPIASLCGSGNLGITSMLSVSALCDALNLSEDKRAQALAISMLTAIYIKKKMKRVTVLCGTALAGASGASAAAAFVYGGGVEEIENAIDTTIGTIGGMLCDGAKESCAFKASLAAENGIVIGQLASTGVFIKRGAGIISKDTETNVNNIAFINNECMDEVDRIILKIMRSNKA